MKHVKNIFHIMGLFIFILLNPFIGLLLGVLTIPYHILVYIFPGIKKVFAKKALPEESRVSEVEEVEEVEDVNSNDKFPSGDFPNSGLPADFNDLPF